MRRVILFSLCFMALAPIGGTVSPAPVPGWDEFWRSVKVEPPPPRDFLAGPLYLQIFNRTEGRVDEDTARLWVLGDVRRSRGDLYAGLELRTDIANAGVFGPPGLNGTLDGIRALRSKGAVRVKDDGMIELVSAAVVWVPPKLRGPRSKSALTEYVIVLAMRVTGRAGKIVYQDGHSEPLPAHGAAGDMHYQLDTGHFMQHPVLGPLWYQQKGWSCTPGDGTVTGEICASGLAASH